MLYKYFQNADFQQEFLEEGVVYFNSLSYFLSCEDISRRDDKEDLSLYRPHAGLEINTDFGVSFRDPRFFVSRIKKPDSVFVFCTSKACNPDLFKKFNAAGCISILDVNEFEKRLKKALLKKARLGIIKNTTLISGPVSYYNQEDESGTRYACPDQIIMSKLAHPCFMAEEEYRFCFAKDEDAFDVDNLDYMVASGLLAFKGRNGFQKLRLGDLRDICKSCILE